MPEDKDIDDYEVGYKKPPRHNQFKKGQSGNPNGRPKGSRNFATDVKATLQQGVRVTEGGKPRTVSTQFATLLRLREKALSGDGRALDRLLELARLYNDEDLTESTKLSSGDAEILEAFTARQLRRAGVTTLEPEAGVAKNEVPEPDQGPNQEHNTDETEEEDNDARLR